MHLTYVRKIKNNLKDIDLMSKHPPRTNLVPVYSTLTWVITSIQYGIRLLYRFFCKYEHQSSHAVPGLD